MIEAAASPQTLAAIVKNPEDRAEQARSIFTRLGGRRYAVVVFDSPLDAMTLGVLWIALWVPGVVLAQTIPR